ncbi:MAG: hypothetical protein H7296_04305 [Bacteroidia bacterium]|nr:hypothetical protein [Bacteroidia bacterium]
MFNELSLSQVDSISDVRKVLETFVKSYIRAKEFGLTEIRIHERVKDLYQFKLHDNYRIDTWLKDNEVNYDLKDRFREIVANPPLIREDEIMERSYMNAPNFIKLLMKQKTLFLVWVQHTFMAHWP